MGPPAFLYPEMQADWEAMRKQDGLVQHESDDRQSCKLLPGDAPAWLR